MRLKKLFLVSLALISMFVLSCSSETRSQSSTSQYPPGTGPADKLQLPPPFASPSVRNTSKVIGWPPGKMPTAAPGFVVSLFAEGLNNPREAYVLPNKDILVVEAVRIFPDRPAKSANQITLFRDTIVTESRKFARFSCPA